MGALARPLLSPDSGLGANGAGGGGAGGEESKPKIQMFSQGLGSKRAGETWKRKANLTGTGATHVKSFHCKLNEESMQFMDQQINDWLDNHPEYEVKMVSSSVGDWQGKIKEPSLIISVWV